MGKKWERKHIPGKVEGLEPPPKAKTKGGASGAAAPNDDPRQPAKAEGKVKGKALEPPAKATPKGGASGAAVSGDEPQPPANAKVKGKGKGFGDGSGEAALDDGHNEAAALATPKENASGVAASSDELTPEPTDQPAAVKRKSIWTVIGGLLARARACRPA